MTGNTTLGMILPIQGKDVPLDQLWEELVEEVVEAERAGFTHVFLSDFHQARGGALVSAYTLGAALLQATTTMRFGCAVLAGPLYHPVKLAEDLLMLDWISRGRAVLGIGIGHLPPDFAMYGVDRGARGEIIEEMLDIIGDAFAGRPFEHHGAHFDVVGEVTSGAYTPGGPEVWMGAHARPGLERAGRRADVWISDPQRDIPTIARLVSRYREAAAEHGRPGRVALYREAWIGDDRADCERRWAPHAMGVHRLYFNVGVYRKVFEPWVDDVVDRDDFTLDVLAPGRFAYGSPDDVRQTLSEWSDVTGAEHIALRLRHPGGPGHDEVLEAIRRFGEEVVGRF